MIPPRTVSTESDIDGIKERNTQRTWFVDFYSERDSFYISCFSSRLRGINYREKII
jgi:hypothetical protein